MSDAGETYQVGEDVPWLAKIYRKGQTFNDRLKYAQLGGDPYSQNAEAEIDRMKALEAYRDHGIKELMMTETLAMAFMSETGLRPSECEIVTQRNDDVSEVRTWIRKRR